MAKPKVVYFCKECGYESPKWMGKCPSCNHWNTFTEEVLDKGRADLSPITGSSVKSEPIVIQDVTADTSRRTQTSNKELNRVLGGGIVPGSIVLIGGEPGIGKSTLMLQVALSMADTKILYVSGEESAGQVKLRADRIGFINQTCYLLAETETQAIFKQCKELNPDLIVVDSIQTLHSRVIDSAPGSISQVRETAGEMLRYAKETGTPVFLIGHITKDGTIAGPKILEHMVDTVLQFEGDRHLAYRLLRSVKNRFGSTSELGIYEMQGEGLREVSNPSEILITQREGELSGVCIGATLEGNRPLLIEVQCLASTAAYGTPQRTTTGFDNRRLNMLLAVLEKRGGFRLGAQDVFLNIAGGLKVDDPALDLAVCAAVVSSYEDISISAKACFAAEVGLGGEIRAVNKAENRVAEAEKLGFEEIYVSKFCKFSQPLSNFNIKIHSVSHLREVFSGVFG